MSFIDMFLFSFFNYYSYLRTITSIITCMHSYIIIIYKRQSTTIATVAQTTTPNININISSTTSSSTTTTSTSKSTVTRERKNRENTQTHVQHTQHKQHTKVI